MDRMDSNLVSAELDKAMRLWRQHLHRNPEFGFEEEETARFVVQRLREFGIDEIETAVGKTGIVATILLYSVKKTADAHTNCCSLTSSLIFAIMITTGCR